MASSSSTPPPGETSYTAMSMPEKDLEAIGAHCQFEYCNQLDFLPFRCESCHSTFCLDHRTETAHKCPKAGEWARNRQRKSTGQLTNATGGRTTKPTVYDGQQCSDPKCKTLIYTFQNTGVHCQTCNRDYCLKHRFQEEHDCKNLTPIGARPASSTPSPQIQAKLAFGKLRSWSKAKTTSITASLPKPKPTPRATAAADLANLKRIAKGDANVSPDKRIYLHVEAEARTTDSKIPKMELYFDKAWTVGRFLDDAAKKMQVKNENNSTQGEEERLRVFFVEGGRVLEFKERLGECLGSGNTVVLLRGLGPSSSSSS